METLLVRGVEEIIDKEHLLERIHRGDKLRVKLGIDPTAKDLHLGHTVVLRKLKQFQDAGHTAVFIIGDFTATIGDPSGKNETRPSLSQEAIQENMKNYLHEASKVIDVEKAEVHYNSEWYKDKGPHFLMELASKFTVARMLERDDFQKRLKEDAEISLLEILYPILQGYDSVAVKADLELGGTDQKFNLLAGRKVQKRYDQPEQDILTVPLIEGLDGVKKMSKSLGNYVGIVENAESQFGKIMSIPDELIFKYFELITDVSNEEITSLKSINPRDAKARLGFEIVKMYHGEKEAHEAQENFTKTFSQRQIPEDIKEFSPVSFSIVDVIVDSGLVDSRSEAKRLIDQKAVHINNEVIDEWGYEVKSEDVIKVGPRKFLKIK